MSVTLTEEPLPLKESLERLAQERRRRSELLLSKLLLGEKDA